MGRACGYKDTTTGHPCDNPVEDWNDHCAANHYCPPVTSIPTAVDNGQGVSPSTASFDVEDLVASPPQAEHVEDPVVAQPQTKHDETLQILEQGILNLTDSDRWTAWLESAAKFHNYSFNNQMLIAIQRPDASQVAGYRTWEKLGRHVNKGEHGIRILAPSLVHIKSKTEDEAENESKDVTEEKKEKTEKTRMFFRTVSVFDVSQTDGVPLPEIASLLSGQGPEGMWSALNKFIADKGFDVCVEDTGKSNGWCRHTDKKIAVKATNDPAMQNKTLVHEIAHAMMHGEDHGVSTLGRSLVELEAESVAFVVCRSLGFDTGDYSFGYVANWAHGGEKAVEDIKASAGRIHDTAQQILSAIDLSKVEPVTSTELQAAPA